MSQRLAPACSGMLPEEDASWLGGEALIRQPDGWAKSGAPSAFLSSIWTCAAGAVGTVAMAAFVRLVRAQEPVGPVGHNVAQIPLPERSREMNQPQSFETRPSEYEEQNGLGAVTVLIAFGLGVMASATAALLSTPEAGSAIRRRLQQGADAVRREFDQVLEETKETWGGVGEQAREAVKQTTARLKEAASTTKDAWRDQQAAPSSAPESDPQVP